jgi:hypothetical protein
MSLNRGEVNPLNVLGFRKLSFIPDHFAKVFIEHKIDTKAVGHWIEFNLNSRYAIKISQGLDVNRKIIQLTEIGLEDPKEITMLTLGCNYLYKQKKEY